MSTTTTAPSSRPPTTPTATRGGPARRSVPHLLLGLVLVSSCTAGAVFWSLNVGDRRPALALARAVTIGQTIQADDLREVSVALEGVDAIPAGDAPSIVGQAAAVSLPAGVLLARGMLGTTRVPTGDHAVAALAVKPGQAPPDIGAGAHVLVVRAADPDSAPATTSGSTWPGVVVAATAQANDGGLVVSVELTDTDARSVAAAPAGRLSVVLVAGGER